MVMTALQENLHAFSGWRRDLLEEIESYKAWLDEENLLDAQDELRLLELIRGLRNDHIKLALVAEFSRGKTELINSIFFADHKRRLLPSSVGRTTMCPTEILYYPEEDPYIQLLPIETRKSSLSIEEYKDAPVNWTRIDLDIDSPEQMSEALSQLIKVRQVSEAEAKSLGFPPHCLDHKPNGMLEVPQWRHAIINFPHPILESGLVILDTPGLNALGTEPELTLSMLPSAHSVLFVLAADTGVTRSDMDIWRNHVVVSINPRMQNAMAVLNKIDTLWDDLHDESVTRMNIQRQIRETAHILDIDERFVMPVSAQKGLLAKVRNDPVMLNRSGLPALEKVLSSDLVKAKQKLIKKKASAELSDMVSNTLKMYQSRLASLDKERTEINKLRGKSEDVLAALGSELKQQNEKLTRASDEYHKSRRILNDQAKRLRSHLSSKNVDSMINTARVAMRESWNTIGLKRGMTVFFDQARERMEEVDKGTAELAAEVNRIYSRFRLRHDIKLDDAAQFAIDPFIDDFDKLHRDGSQFRDSMLLVMTEQHYVIKRFFITLASRARRIMDETNYALSSWSKALLTPIKTQIDERKRELDHRLANIEQMRSSHDDIALRMAQIESQVVSLRDKINTLKRILQRIEYTD
jgi:hypothetical protein